MKLSVILGPLLDAKADHELIRKMILAHESEIAEAIEKRRENDRIRQQRKRDKEASHVTSRDVTVTRSSRAGATRGLDNLQTKNQAGQKKIKDSLDASASVSEKFSEFWLVYPRREGSNPKKPAQVIFQRLVAKGCDPDAIIEAAKTLAAEHPAPTRYVPQAQTWLNQERFADTAPVITGDTFCASDAPATRLHLIRHRNERGHDPPPAIHGGKAGFLIPTEWVKAMELRQANG